MPDDEVVSDTVEDDKPDKAVTPKRVGTPHLPAEVNTITLDVAILKQAMENPGIEPQQIVETLAKDGMVVTVEQVKLKLKDLFFSQYGDRYEIIGNETAKGQMQYLINNALRLYDVLYQILEDAKSKFEEGMMDAAELVLIAKEMRQREQMMIALLRSQSDVSDGQPSVQINQFLSPDGILQGLKDEVKKRAGQP